LELCSSSAEEGKLRDEGFLREQVRRKLRDPRSRGLAVSFTSQWLGLRALSETVRPDPHRFPEFDAALAEAMRQEPTARPSHRQSQEHAAVQSLYVDVATDGSARAQLRRQYWSVGRLVLLRHEVSSLRSE
jgi:hypothetical protein